MKRLWLILFVISSVWGQGGYGIYGYRNEWLKTSPKLDSDGFYYDRGSSTKALKKISIKNSHVIGFGYRWVNKNKYYFNKLNPTTNFYVHMGINSFEYSNRRTHSQLNVDSAIGYGKGLRFSNGISISTNIEYTFGGLHDGGGTGYNAGGTNQEHFTVPVENYFSFNIKMGFGGGSKFGHSGIYNTRYLNRRFLNKNGPILRSNEISVEMPIVIVGAIFMALGASDSRPSRNNDRDDDNSCRLDGSQLTKTFESKIINGQNQYMWRCSYGHEYWFPERF